MSTFTGAVTARNSRYVVLPYPKPLPPGTRVRRISDGQFGVVRDTIFHSGVFPVDWNSGFSELCARDDVTVIGPAADGVSAA